MTGDNKAVYTMEKRRLGDSERPVGPLAFGEKVFGRTVDEKAGASNFSRDRLTPALQTSERPGMPRYQTLQPRYNLCESKRGGGMTKYMNPRGFRILDAAALEALDRAGAP